MSHDASKVVMGQTAWSAKDVVEFDNDPASFPAGTAVRLKSDGTLSKTLADGQWLGVSLGRSLSSSKKTAICRAGLKVPMLVEYGPARLVITITSYANLVAVSDDTLQFEHAGLSLDETLTFKASASTEDEVAAATNNNTTATALAAKISNHSVLGLHFIASAVGAVVTVTARDNEVDGADVDVTYVDNSSVGLTLDDATFTGGGASPDFIVLGAKVYVSDTSGKADDAASDSTISDAVYVSGLLTGIDEDGAEVSAVLVDMPGGL